MNKLMAIVIGLVFTVTAGLALAQSGAEPAIKAGASVYACGCGAGCGCGTLSNKAGKCGCGKKMVQTTITKVADGKAYYQMDGKEMSASTTGKYVCGCGAACTCGTVSQKPGTCGCGQPLKEVN
jgi:hypothetical protein